jgi:hypothetical protein
LVAHNDAVLQWVHLRAQADVAGLLDVVGSKEQWFTDAAWSRVREAVRSHFWVQVERDAQWVDLDSAFPKASAGQRFAEGSVTFEPDRPPADLVHAITLSVTAEYGDAKSRSTQELLRKTISTSDLVVEQIGLSNVPAEPAGPESLQKANRFRPVLRVGDRQTVGSEYQLLQKPDMPDIGGALFGAETPSVRELTALWLDVTLARPGAPPRVERRYFVDRVGADARASGKESLTPVPAERLPYLVLREYDILVMPAPYPKFLPSWLGCRQVLANRRLLEQAVEVRFGRADRKGLVPSAEKSGRLSLPLLALAGEVSEELRETREGARLVLSEPFVAMIKHAFAARSAIEDPVGLARFEEGVDVVATGTVPAGGSPAARARLGLVHGAFLTNLELAFAGWMASPNQSLPSNASVSFESSRAKSQRAVVVRQSADEAATGFAGDRLAVLRAQREQGYVLITAVADAGAPQSGPESWWRLDPASGVVLGVRDTGEGQALTEDEQILFILGGAGWCQLKSWANAQSRIAQGKDWGTTFYVFGQVFCIALGVMGVAGVLGAGLGWAAFAFVLGIGGDCIGLY